LWIHDYYRTIKFGNNILNFEGENSFNNRKDNLYLLAIQTYESYLGSLIVDNVSMFSETNVETCVVCVLGYSYTPWVSVSVIFRRKNTCTYIVLHII